MAMVLTKECNVFKMPESFTPNGKLVGGDDPSPSSSACVSNDAINTATSSPDLLLRFDGVSTI